jgi:hypothetical protein
MASDESMSALAEDYNLGLDLRDLFAAVAVRRWWVLSTVVLLAAAFSASAFPATPICRGTTVLAPTRPARTDGMTTQLGGLAAVTGLEISSRNSEAEEALAVLRSREFTENFIATNTFMPELFSREMDSAHGHLESRPPASIQRWERRTRYSTRGYAP